MVDLTLTGVFFPASLLAFATSLLPLAALVLLLVAFRSRRRRGDGVILGGALGNATAFAAFAFAAFVVGLDGDVLSYQCPLAFFLALVAMRFVIRRRPEQLEAGLVELRGAGDDFSTVQARLFRWAHTADRTRRSRSRTYESFVASDERDTSAYARELERLRTTEESIGSRVPALLGRRSPGSIALGLGPCRTWWGNACAGARIAAMVAAIPAAFYVYSTLHARRPYDGSLGVAYVLQGLLYELAFWIVSGFVLGLLYPYLWGPTGAAKGAVLALAFAAARGLAVWILPGAQPAWMFRALQLLVFLGVVGIAVDIRTLRERGLPWQHIVDRYQIRDIRVLASYASPLLISLIVIAQQVYSGRAQDAVTEIIKVIPNLANVQTSTH